MNTQTKTPVAGLTNQLVSTVDVLDDLDVVNDHPKLCLMSLPPAPPVLGMIRLYNYHLSPHAQYLLASSLSRVLECDDGDCMEYLYC